MSGFCSGNWGCRRARFEQENDMRLVYPIVLRRVRKGPPADPN